jgi:AraC-like DNA-binding protein
MILLITLARGGTIALLLLWSGLLVRDHWRLLPARLAIAMNATIICHVVATIPGTGSGFPIGFIFQVGAGMVSAFFWLFAKTWFNDEKRVGWAAWAAVAIALALLIPVVLADLSQPPVFLTLAFLWRASLFGFALAGLWEAWRGRANDLVEPRRHFRAILVVVVALAVALTNIVEILTINTVIPPESRELLQLFNFILTFGICQAMFAVQQQGLFGAPPKSDVSQPSITDDPLANRLLTHMTSERPYRLETLTIAGLAAQLGEQEYRVRRVINGQMGHRNFAAFLNGYRLDEVRQALADPEQREVPILTIALDAGFGSLGPFNRAFREAEAMTPSAYRAAKLS